MQKASKANGHWSEDKILAEAINYETLDAFRMAQPSAYSRAARTGLLPKLRTLLTVKKQPNGYFTKELCAKIATDFTTRGAFFRDANSAYAAARKNGWLNEVCTHMKRGVRVSDMNVLYVITPNNLMENEFPVKFGITSARRNNDRLAESARLIHDPVVRLNVETADAKQIETTLLRMFQRKPIAVDTSIIGHSEIRMLTGDDYAHAMKTIETLLMP